MIIRTLHAVDKDKLTEVKAEMEKRGAPEIRAIWDGEIYWAVEGTHRLAAADALGLTAEIIEIDAEGMLPADVCDEMDYEITGIELIDMVGRNWQGRDYSA